MDGREITTVEAQPMAVALAPSMTPQQWAQRRKEFNEWVNSQLKEGIDYGTIPGVQKPSLWQPGAQKIDQYYGCAPLFKVSHRERDLSTGFLYAEVTCQLVSLQTGQVVAEGLGCCSTYEVKYRYRKEWWNGKGEPPKNQGWERTRRGKWYRRIENTEMFDLWNTIIKMAGKRAHVAASSNISAASERFTQDAEDLPPDMLNDETPTPTKRKGRPAPPPPAREDPNGRDSAPLAQPKPKGAMKSGGKEPMPWTKDQAYIRKMHGRIAQYCEDLGLTFPAKGPDSAYERMKREAFGIEHLSEFVGTAQEFAAIMDDWFQGVVDAQIDEAERAEKEAAA